MIENKGKKYYTTFEIVDLINDETSEFHKLWAKCFPNYKNVVLMEQVDRVLYKAKKEKAVSIVEFTKQEGASRKYFAFLIDDIIEYIANKNKAYNMKFIDKEK